MPDTSPSPGHPAAPLVAAPLALSGGDPAGIGYDIALDSWLARTHGDVPAFAMFADPSALAERARVLKRDVPIEVVASPLEALAVFGRALPVVAVPCATEVVPGRPESRNGAAVIASIERATAAVVAGQAAALVTNPIAKHVLYAAGFAHPGHTEFLAELAARFYPGGPYTSVMMLAADELKVVPLTIHIALSAVPALVTGEGIQRTVRIMQRALRLDFGCAAPRIAVAGLNPHAGENGTMGVEDRDIIAPAIASLRAEGINVKGPYSGDTLFHPQARAGYDAVLAMYHDQALIPLKTLAFDRGVNITLGLPFVRTSPDHGTAFDIAGSGRASPASLLEALRAARRMALHRAAQSVRP